MSRYSLIAVPGVWMLGLMLGLGCAKPQLGHLPDVVATAPDGALGPDDVFEIRVYNEPEISGVHRMANDGTIDYPLIGSVSLVGLTASQAARRLEEVLTQFVLEPQVSLFVREYNSQKIFVFGEVNKPGTFRYAKDMNLVEAITLAGGFNKVADTRGTYVTRKIDGEEHKMRVSVKAIATGEQPNIVLMPGDIIYVPETVF